MIFCSEKITLQIVPLKERPVTTMPGNSAQYYRVHIKFYTVQVQIHSIISTRIQE